NKFDATPLLARGDLLEFFDVCACDKRPPSADQNRRLHAWIFVDLIDGGGNPVAHSLSQSIHRRIVDGNDGDVAVFGQLNQVAHGVEPLSSFWISLWPAHSRPKRRRQTKEITRNQALL